MWKRPHLKLYLCSSLVVPLHFTYRVACDDHSPCITSISMVFAILRCPCSPTIAVDMQQAPRCGFHSHLLIADATIRCILSFFAPSLRILNFLRSLIQQKEKFMYPRDRVSISSSDEIEWQGQNPHRCMDFHKHMNLSARYILINIRGDFDQSKKHLFC